MKQAEQPGIQTRLGTLPDIAPPDIQHVIGNPPAGIGIDIQVLPQGTPPDTDMILIRRSQQRRTVAAEKAVAVHPGRIIRLRKQQRLRLPAGQGAAARRSLMNRNITELGQEPPRLRRISGAEHDYGFPHAVTAHGGDHQENAPEIIHIACRHNRIAVTHTLSLPSFLFFQQGP